jgi:hypothetical protein
MRGLAKTATEHREAIERVVTEQVNDPEPIEEGSQKRRFPPEPRRKIKTISCPAS